MPMPRLGVVSRNFSRKLLSSAVFSMHSTRPQLATKEPVGVVSPGRRALRRRIVTGSIPSSSAIMSSCVSIPHAKDRP